MTNKLISLIATVLVLVSINNAHAQIINFNIVNDTSDSRYVIHTDGTVTDIVTGLMWQQCSLGQTGSDCSFGSATKLTWQGALELAENNTTASYTDWRVPNIKELLSLVAYDRYAPSINSVAFPNTKSDRYWSSSPYADYNSGSRQVSFLSGHGSYNFRYLIEDDYVRLVRSGQ